MVIMLMVIMLMIIVCMSRFVVRVVLSVVRMLMVAMVRVLAVMHMVVARILRTAGIVNKKRSLSFGPGLLDTAHAAYHDDFATLADRQTSVTDADGTGWFVSEHILRAVRRNLRLADGRPLPAAAHDDCRTENQRQNQALLNCHARTPYFIGSWRFLHRGHFTRNGGPRKWQKGSFRGSEAAAWERIARRTPTGCRIQSPAML
jgi:hypothetical protein